MSEAAYRRFVTQLNSKKMSEETLSFYRELFSEYERSAAAEQ